jgi:hypothetical protein
MKFSRDQKVEFKKSLKLYRQILLEVLMKGGINFVHFAWTKVSEKKARFDIMLKMANFSYQQYKLRKNLKKFCKIFLSFMPFYGI